MTDEIHYVETEVGGILREIHHSEKRRANLYRMAPVWLAL